MPTTGMSVPEPRFRTDTEREILRVLWMHRTDFLVRSQVLHRMMIPSSKRPSLVRVGQILKALHVHEYLDEEKDRYQGRKLASFYRLNARGISTCHQRYRFHEKEQIELDITAEDRKKYITPKFFGGSPNGSPRRIISFYSYRGSVGQTSMVAHTASGLAEASERKDVLIVDLDTSAPDLDAFFPPQDPQSHQLESRGLRGLIVDYFKKRDWERQQWLVEAIQNNGYLTRPRYAELPNLFYLSSGMSRPQDAAENAEQTHAFDYLRSEISRLATTESKELGFLENLRDALLQRFHLVLVDSAAGRGLGTLAALRLADQLVLSTRPNERPEILNGLRDVVTASFKHQDLQGRPGSGAIMTLHLSEHGRGEFNGLSWLQDHFFEDHDAKVTPKHFWLFRHNRRLEDPTNWGLTTVYQPLIKRLSGIHTREVYLPPEVKALKAVLDPETSNDYRNLLTSSLEATNFEDLARHLEWLSREDLELPAVDEEGLKLIRNIVQFQCHKVITRLRRRTQKASKGGESHYAEITVQ